MTLPYLSKQEIFVVALVSIGVVLVVFLPWVYGSAITPEGHTFLFRQNVNFYDTSVYLSYIEQAKDGRVLFSNLFTSEPQAIGIFSPFWLLVGIVANIFSLDSVVALHLFRFLLIPAFLTFAYYFIAFFFKEKAKRVVAFVFLTFSAGWGWMITSGVAVKNNWRVLDKNVPEAFAFTSMYYSPHFVVSLALLMMIFLFSVLYVTSHRLRYSICAGTCALVLFSFHPYHMPTVFGVLSLFAIVYSIRARSINWHHLIHLATLLLFSLPAIGYYVWILMSVPVIYEHFLQNITLTPPFPILVVSYGFLLPLACVGWWALYRRKEKTVPQIFLMAWFLAQLVLIYLPIKTQLRLVMGLQVAMVLLVVQGIFYLKDETSLRNIIQRYFSGGGKIGTGITILNSIVLFTILFSLSPINLVVNDIAFYNRRKDLSYISHEKRSAMSWLKNTPSDSIIFASEHNGNMIPVISLKKVFLGHSHETAQYAKKVALTEDFFKEKDSGKRYVFLSEQRIRYFFFGREEKQRAQFDPNQDAGLSKVFENGEVSIYRVN